MADLSDQMPPGGYFLPLLSTEVFDDIATAQTVFGALDQTPERARAFLALVNNAWRLRLAAGADLDEIGTQRGIPRLAGESDDAYRVRIPATFRHGLVAYTNADMAAYLAAIYAGIPVTVTDGPAGTSTAAVTFFGYSPLLASAPALISKVKLAGVVITAQAQLGPGGGTTLVGEFTVGSQAVGGSTGLITLG